MNSTCSCSTTRRGGFGPWTTFVRSPRIISLIKLAKRFNRLPSELLNLEDEYTAFCFDEACGLILDKLESGEEIRFQQKFSSFSELYANYT